MIRKLSSPVRRGAVGKGPAQQGPRQRPTRPQAGRAAAAARDRRVGGQDPPARRRRGAQQHLRDGLPRLLLRVPAWTQPARCAGRGRARDRQEEGELGGKRRDEPAWRRRWKSSTLKGQRPTAAPSHASTTREGVAKRWQGHAQASY